MSWNGFGCNLPLGKQWNQEVVRLEAEIAPYPKGFLSAGEERTPSCASCARDVISVITSGCTGSLRADIRKQVSM